MSKSGKEVTRIVVLVSGSGSNLQAIIDAIESDTIKAEIALVISNCPNVRALERATQAHIPVSVIDHTEYENRDTFDTALIDIIDETHIDLIVLAGFMRILGDAFIDHFAGQILNIHPSLLPDFRGLHTHRRALEAGRKTHGATVHFVGRELDSGSTVIQAEVDVLASDDEAILAERVLQQEHIIYPMAIAWFCDKRLRCESNTAWLDDRKLIKPPRWINNKLVSNE